MSYEQKGSLVDLFDPAPFEAASHEIARRAGLRYWELVRERTPVAKLLGGFSEAEMEDLRGGRKRGTLRDSIRLTPAIRSFGGWEISVLTDDPVAIFVEWDTRPHMIYPRNASTLAWPVAGGDMAFAASVSHPGTKGKHMFQVGAALTEAELVSIGEPVLAAAMRGDVVIAQVAIPAMAMIG